MTKYTNIRLDPEFHKWLKILAAKLEKSMKDIVQEAVKEKYPD